jgi:hypothetical protein
MNREYQLALLALPLQDIEIIRNNITAFANTAAADDWEEGLYEVLDSLKMVAHHQECERESKLLGVSVRRILYRQKGVRRDYHVYYTIKPSPLSEIEPDGFYVAGHVLILYLLHAAQKPLSKKELQARVNAVNAEMEEIDALRAELSQGKGDTNVQ